MDPREAQEGREGMAVDQGERRLRRDRRRPAARVRAVRAHGRGAEGGEGPHGAGSEGARAPQAPRRTVTLEQAEPMLAETREQPFSKPGWLFELKLDGYRVRAAREQGEARLLTRKGNDISAAFPELARALAALPFEGFILDAELVVPDEAGRPNFQRLQNRAKVSRAREVGR